MATKKPKGKPNASAAIETRKIESEADWLVWRRQDVTASAAAGLLGVHDYVTAYRLFLEKTGAEPDSIETAPMRRGRYMEDVALRILTEEHPEIKFWRPGVYLRDPAHRLGATPDLYAICPRRGFGIVQIKSVAEPVYRAKWGRGVDGGPDDLPIWIGIQAAIEASMAEHEGQRAQWAAVAPIVVGFAIDCPLIDIPLDSNAPRVLTAIRQASLDFWAKVEEGVAPEFDYAKDGERIAALYGVSNGETIDLSGNNRIPELLERDEVLRETEKAATDERKTIKNEVLAIMGAAEVAYHPVWDLTYKTTHRKAYEVKATSFRAMRAKRKA